MLSFSEKNDGKKNHFKTLNVFLIILIIEENIAKWTENPHKHLKKKKTYIFLDIIGVSNTSKLKGEAVCYIFLSCVCQINARISVQSFLRKLTLTGTQLLNFLSLITARV